MAPGGGGPGARGPHVRRDQGRPPLVSILQLGHGSTRLPTPRKGFAQRLLQLKYFIVKREIVECRW